MLWSRLEHLPLLFSVWMPSKTADGRDATITTTSRTSTTSAVWIPLFWRITSFSVGGRTLQMVRHATHAPLSTMGLSLLSSCVSCTATTTTGRVVFYGWKHDTRSISAVYWSCCPFYIRQYLSPKNSECPNTMNARQSSQSTLYLFLPKGRFIYFGLM